MAEMTAFQVLITNLPRPEKEEDESDNIRESAFPETVLKLYLDQYKQEHVFSLRRERSDWLRSSSPSRKGPTP